MPEICNNESDLPKQPCPQASQVQNYRKCPLCPYLPLLAYNKRLEMAGFLAFLLILLRLGASTSVMEAGE